MGILKNIAIVLFLILSFTACNSEKTTRHKDANHQPAVNHSPQKEKPSRASREYVMGDPNDYAEKKTTNELEEEYYIEFGDKYIENVADEEYEAAEVYEEHQEDYDD